MERRMPIYPRSCTRCGGAMSVEGHRADADIRCLSCGHRPNPRALPYLTGGAARELQTPVAGPSQAALDLQAEVEEHNRRERAARGRRLAAEFRLLYSQGVTVTDAAKKLGVSARTLHRWLKAAK